MGKIDPMQPTLPKTRIDVLDALRGFALLGILLVNLYAFAGLDFPASDTDQVARDLTIWLVAEKFYTLFSLLLGVGIALQLRKGTDALRFVRRRYWVLLGIGAIHGTFLWSGDILFVYSSIALILLGLGLYRQSDGVLLTLALGLWLFSTWVSLTSRIPVANSALIGENIPLLATGSYLEVRLAEAPQWLWTALLTLIYFGPNILGFFLLGIWFGRRLEWLNQLERWRSLALGALPLGLWLNWQYLHSGASGWMPLSGLVLTLGYVSLLVLLWNTPLGQTLLTPLVYAGRMPLTNYLSQSLIGTTVFYGYALGWYGKIGHLGAIGVGLAIYGLQLLWSRLWFSRFGFGPLEWLWRKLTYGSVT